MKVLAIVNEAMKEIIANIERLGLGFSCIFPFSIIFTGILLIASIFVCKSHKPCL